MRLNIVKWNPINDEYGDIRASVFIKPTLELLEFANRNVSNGNRTMMVRISGSGHPIYDGAPFFAILDKSSDAPNCRQNFFNTTGLYILTLSARWFGYPENLGEVTFSEGVLLDTYGNSQSSESSESSQSSQSSQPSQPSQASQPITEKYEISNNLDNAVVTNNVNNTVSIESEDYDIKKVSMIGGIVVVVLVLLIMAANVYDNSKME